MYVTYSSPHNNPMIGSVILFAQFMAEEVKDQRDEITGPMSPNQ